MYLHSPLFCFSCLHLSYCFFIFAYKQVHDILSCSYDDKAACQMILDKMGLKGYQVIE